MSASELHGTAASTRGRRRTPPAAPTSRAAAASSCRSARSRAIDIHLTHRAFMYLASTLVLALFAGGAAQRRRLDPDSAARADVAQPARPSSSCVVQVLLGALNVWLGEHAWLIVAHLTVRRAAVGVAGALLAARARARRSRPSAPRAARRAVQAAPAGGSGLMEAGARARRPAAAGSWLYGARRAGRRLRRAHEAARDLAAARHDARDDVRRRTRRPGIGVILATMLGGYLAAGGAGAINHYIERDIDARMTRTSRRPLPAGPRSSRAPRSGSGSRSGALSFALFALAVNMTAALLAMAGLLGYVFVYTLWLKPRTSQNIVIGGAAGAVPPLVGWAAAAGHLDASAFYLFAIVFYWTPPHFWALALLIKDDYARTGIPMLPVVDGEAETRRQILLYGWLLLAITALPLIGGLFGVDLRESRRWCSTAVFLWLCVRLYRRADRRSAAILFHYSLAYLALLFAAMAIDNVVCRPSG